MCTIGFWCCSCYLSDGSRLVIKAMSDGCFQNCIWLKAELWMCLNVNCFTFQGICVCFQTLLWFTRFCHIAEADRWHWYFTVQLCNLLCHLPAHRTLNHQRLMSLMFDEKPRNKGRYKAIAVTLLLDYLCFVAGMCESQDGPNRISNPLLSK